MKSRMISLAIGALCLTQTAQAAIWSQIPNTTYTWTDAYRHCAGLRSDGRSDWRLPTALELNGRFKNNVFRPPWDPKGSVLDWLWTSTRKNGGPFFKVNANNGARSWHDYPAYVMCVADSTSDPDAWLEDYLGAEYLKDWNRAVRIALPQAKKQNPLALVFMAKNYFEGTGVPKNEAEGFKLYLASAKQGYALGQLSVGQLYELGRGTARDTKAAMYWYAKAAAQNELGAAESIAKLQGTSTRLVTDSAGDKCSADRLLSATSIVPEKPYAGIKKPGPKWFSVTWKDSKGIVKMIGSMTESDLLQSHTRIGSTACYDNPDEGSPDNPV
jgi:hypothetical protein